MRIKKLLCSILMFVTLFSFVSLAADYRLYDDAGIFSGSTQGLQQVCSELSAQGVNVVVNSYTGGLTSEEYCYRLGKEEFGREKALVFVVNMTKRDIYLRGINGAEKVITAGLCRSITDNSYRLASNGDYVGCAESCLRQCLDIYNGRRISQPMKYIVNIWISLLTGLLVTYALIIFSRRKGVVTASDKHANCIHQCKVKKLGSRHIKTTRTKRVESSSGGSGGGGGFHGGGGGGGFSGGGGGGHGGGGHSF